MKCPVCKTDTLGLTTLIENLPAKQCSHCGGIWLDSNAYLAWWKGKGGDMPQKQAAAQIDPAWDVDELKLCPNSGHIMGRYKILADTDYHLDRCGHCNGIWFDKHEWDALVEMNLHDNVNEFFTRPWQDEIRATETHHHMERLYREKLGAEDYERIQRIREWLKDHPRKGMLFAFLQADDPYKI